MKFANTLIAAILAGVSIGAVAHEDSNHKKKSGAVRMEQKDWGIAGQAKAVKRTIEIRMGDNMRFSPERIEVKQGEVVKFVMKNNGKLMHELVIGTKKVLEEHAALMVKFPTMEHDEPYMAHIKPGATGQMIWNFNRPGEFDFACLINGHYQAGMIGKITVVASNAATAETAAAAPATKKEAHGHKH